MNQILKPGYRLMSTLRNGPRTLFLNAMHWAPLAIVLYVTRDRLEPEILALVAFFMLLTAYLMYCFYAQAQEGFMNFCKTVERLAAGNLTGRIDTGNIVSGHWRDMMGELGRVNENLGEIVSQVRSSAEEISLGAADIAAGNSNLSERSEQQASTLEETASGMEQLSATVKQNAENCKQASHLAQSAKTAAEQGAEAVHRVVERMNEIDRSSKKISDIIGVIEGIAFQTNILALNAAVEAARAGEQGRGFAVVASEVRSLAQRSAAAAKDIKKLIGESMGQVSEGNRQARGAGTMIDEIVAKVGRTNHLIGEIAVASTEQSSGLQEINKAILQLESMTQQNVALGEEAAANAVAFQVQSERLVKAVAKFLIDDHAASALPAAPVTHVAQMSPVTPFLPKRAYDPHPILRR